jgi:hypothetical protein
MKEPHAKYAVVFLEHSNAIQDEALSAFSNTTGCYHTALAPNFGNNCSLRAAENVL